MKSLQFDIQRGPLSLREISRKERINNKKEVMISGGALFIFILVAGLSFVFSIALLFGAFAGLLFFMMVWYGPSLRSRIDFNELTPELFPQQCINLAEWGDNDEIIQTYLKRVGDQERPLLIGDYRAAREWINGAEERDLVSKARSACNKMANGEGNNESI